MSKLIIEGGKRLQGKVRIPGAKNTILPILAATIISGKETVIQDCPKISDVELTLDILRDLGCNITRDGSTVTVDSSSVTKYTIDSSLMEKMRSSIKTLSGESVNRVQMNVYNLDDEKEFNEFARGNERLLKIHGSEDTVVYDPIKRTGVAISRLGANEAISIGAYVFALAKIDGNM